MSLKKKPVTGMKDILPQEMEIYITRIDEMIERKRDGIVL